MDEFKTILLNDDFSIAYYSKKKNKDYATLKCKIKKEYPSDEEIKAYIDSINDFYANGKEFVIDENKKEKDSDLSEIETKIVKILEEKKPEPVHTPQNKVKMPQFGSGYQNRIERNSRSKAMMNEGAVVESGTRQVWALPQSYRPEVHSHQPCLVVSGNQGLRISFHRDAGSILQDLEIPPSEEETEIGLSLIHI